MSGATKVIHAVITEAVTYERRYRVPGDFDTDDVATVEALFIHDDRAIDGVVGVLGRDVLPVSVSTVTDAAFDVDYNAGVNTVAEAKIFARDRRHCLKDFDITVDLEILASENFETDEEAMDFLRANRGAAEDHAECTTYRQGVDSQVRDVAPISAVFRQIRSLQMKKILLAGIVLVVTAVLLPLRRRSA